MSSCEMSGSKLGFRNMMYIHMDTDLVRRYSVLATHFRCATTAQLDGLWKLFRIAPLQVWGELAVTWRFSGQWKRDTFPKFGGTRDA
jgi:hypothetical protein